MVSFGRKNEDEGEAVLFEFKFQYLTRKDFFSILRRALKSFLVRCVIL